MLVRQNFKRILQTKLEDWFVSQKKKKKKKKIEDWFLLSN